MNVSKLRRGRYIALPLLLTFAVAGCAQQIDSSDSAAGSCGQVGLKQGLALFQPPSSTLVVATVGALGTPQAINGSRGRTVYTPVTLTGVELLSGSSVPTEVFLHGGTADRHTTTVDAHNYLGLVEGGKVLMAIGTDPGSLGGPGPHPPGAYVQTTLPIDDKDHVLVSGCMNAKDVPGSVEVTEAAEAINAQKAVEKITVTGSKLPLSSVRAAVRQVLKP